MIDIDSLIGKDVWFKFKVNYITDEFSWAKLLDKRYDAKHGCECYIFNCVSNTALDRLHMYTTSASGRQPYYMHIVGRPWIVPVTEIDNLFSEWLADRDLMTTEELFGFND